MLVGLQVNLKKKESGFWERMTEQPSKATKNWLSCDWARWVDEDDDKGGFPGMDNFGYGDTGNMDLGGMGGMGDMGGGDSDDDEPPADLGDLDKKEEEEEEGRAKPSGEAKKE